MQKRLREIDFLRGIAILLVLFRHQHVTGFTTNIGWMGVDLFFVLSGFLVSGLLFSEHKKYGNINARSFLIRRGFKIYPVYYITYAVYLLPLLYAHKVNWVGVVADLLFIQNYVLGWGYAYSASWSLAVEEHFYFGLCFFLWLVMKKWPGMLLANAGKKFSRFELFIFGAMAVCLLLRVLQNTIMPPRLAPQQFSLTHLRIDSLLAGVFISYLYHFRAEKLRSIFNGNRKLLAIVALVCLSWTPFINPEHSAFAKTIGFTLVYIASGIVVTYFLLAENINIKLNTVFSPWVTDRISKIGYSSYSIYIIHTLVIVYVERYSALYFPNAPAIVLFAIVLLVSVSVGMAITYTIEKYFLDLRDRYFPKSRKAGTVVQPGAALAKSI